MLSAVSQQVQCIQEALREHSNPNYDKSKPPSCGGPRTGGACAPLWMLPALRSDERAVSFAPWAQLQAACWAPGGGGGDPGSATLAACAPRSRAAPARAVLPRGARHPVRLPQRLPWSRCWPAWATVFPSSPRPGSRAGCWPVLLRGAWARALGQVSGCHGRLQGCLPPRPTHSPGVRGRQARRCVTCTSSSLCALLFCKRGDCLGDCLANSWPGLVGKARGSSGKQYLCARGSLLERTCCSPRWLGAVRGLVVPGKCDSHHLSQPGVSRCSLYFCNSLWMAFVV